VEHGLEKWQATMELLAGGQTKENIRKRAVTGEAITGTRSRTEFERKSLEEITRAVSILIALEPGRGVQPATNTRKCTLMRIYQPNNTFSEAIRH
jgi:hypothetical protein